MSEIGEKLMQVEGGHIREELGGGSHKGEGLFRVEKERRIQPMWTEATAASRCERGIYSNR